MVKKKPIRPKQPRKPSLVLAEIWEMPLWWKFQGQFGSPLLDLLFDAKIIASKSEGRRLIQQNGLTVGDTKVTDVAAALSETFLKARRKSCFVKRKEKKYYRLILK